MKWLRIAAFIFLVLLAVAVVAGFAINYFVYRSQPEPAALNLKDMMERSRKVTFEVYIGETSDPISFSDSMAYLYSNEYAVVPASLTFMDTPFGTMPYSEAQELFGDLTPKITIRANPDFEDDWKKEELQMGDIIFIDTRIVVFERSNPVFALSAPVFHPVDFGKLSLDDDLYQIAVSFNGAMILNRASLSGFFTSSEGMKVIIFQGGTTAGDFGGALFKINLQTNQPELAGVIFYATNETLGLAIDANKVKEIIETELK